MHNCDLMKKIAMIAGLAAATLVIVFVVHASFGGPKFHVGDHIMPAGSADPTTILRIVGVAPKSYKVFTHFLSDGKLVLAEDYSDQPRALIDRTYIKIPAPTVENTFSPGKYLSKIGASPSPQMTQKSTKNHR